MQTYDEAMQRKVRNWLLLFYLKLLLLFFVLLMFMFSLLDANELGIAVLLPVPVILLLIFLVYRDYKQDPYGVLKFFGEVFKTWWYMNVSNKPGQYPRVEHPFFRMVKQADLDIRREVKVPSGVMKNGGNYVARIKLPGTCPRCDGDRTFDPGGILLLCTSCNGSGKGINEPGAYHAQAALLEKCPDCHGTGYVPDRPCPRCKGTGETMVNKTVKITVPPNTKQGKVLRLRGMGLLDNDRGLVGDLYITFFSMNRLFLLGTGG
jgi:DnaJ-class molecular chaperone